MKYPFRRKVVPGAPDAKLVAVPQTWGSNSNYDLYQVTVEKVAVIQRQSDKTWGIADDSDRDPIAGFATIRHAADVVRTVMRLEDGE